MDSKIQKTVTQDSGNKEKCTSEVASRDRIPQVIGTDTPPVGAEAPPMDRISVVVEDGVPSGTSSGSYKETVRKIRETVSEKFGAAKREVMEKLENERGNERRKNNEEMAKRYETDLRLLSECQLEELENVNVAIKCEIQTVQTRFGIKALSDLVARTNEELMRENLAKLKEMSHEFERSHKEEMEHLHLMYRDQIRVLEEKLELCESETAQRFQDLDQQQQEELQQALAKYKQGYRIEEEIEEMEETKERNSHRDLISSSGDSGYWQSLASPLNRLVLEKDSQTDEQLQELHELEIRRKLEEEYKRKMEEILADHSREIRSREEEMKRIRARFEQDVNQLRETFESEKQELQEKLEQSIPTRSEEVKLELTDTLGTESAEYLKEYASRLEEMERNESEVCELRDLLEERDSNIAELKSRMDKMREESSSQVADLEEEVTRYREVEITKMKKQIERLTEELFEETSERAEDRKRHDEIVSQLKTSAHNQNIEDSLRKEIESYTEIATRLREAVAQLEDEKKRLSVKLEERSEDFAAVNFELEKIQKEMNEERKTSENLRARLIEQENKSGKVQELDNELKQQTKDFEVKISELSIELDEEREAGAQLAEMNQRLQMQTNINEKEIAKLTDMLNQLTASNLELSGEIKALRKDAEVKETALVDQEALSERLQDELEELQGERARKVIRREVREEVWEEVQEDVRREMRQEVEDELRNDFETELERLRQELVEAQSGEEEARCAVNVLEAQIAELEQERQDEASDKELLEKQVNDQLKEISGLKSNLEEIKLKIDDRQIRLEDVERMTQLQRLTEQNEEEIVRKNREIKDLTDQVAKLKEKLAQQREEFQVSTQNDAAQKEQLELEISSQDSFLHEKEALIIKLQTTIKHLTAEVDKISTEKDLIKDSRDEQLQQLNKEKETHYQETVTIIERKLKDKVDELSRLQTELGVAQDGNKDLLQKFTQLEEKQRELKRKLSQKEADNASLLERISELERAESAERSTQASTIESAVQTEEFTDTRINDNESLKRYIKDLELKLAEKMSHIEELEKKEVKVLQQKGNEEAAGAAELEEELTDMRKKKKNLEAELESRIEEGNEGKLLVVKLEFELYELQLDFENKKKLLESARNEMEEKKDECEKHLKLLDEAKDEIEKLKQQLNNTKEEAEAVKQKVEEQQSMKQHDTLVLELRTSLEVEWQTKLTSLLQRHAEELKEAEEVNKERQTNLQAEYKNKMAELEQDYISSDEQRKDMERENQEKLEKLQREMEKKFGEELESEHKRLRTELEESYQVELKKARKEMKDENDELWAEVDKRQKEEIEKITEARDKALSDKDKEMSRLKEEYEICLQSLKAEHAKNIDRLTEKHKQELSNLHQKYKQQLDNYHEDKLQVEEDLKKLNAERLAWSVEREELLADIKELKSKLSRATKEAKHSKESRQRMEAEMRQDEREELLREIDDLRNQIESLHRDMLTENNRLADQLQNLQDSSIHTELQLKLEIETLVDELNSRRASVLRDEDNSAYRERVPALSSKPFEGQTSSANTERLLEQLSALQQALDLEKDRAIRTALALEEERAKNAELQGDQGKERQRRERYAEQYEIEIRSSTKERSQLLALLEKLRAELASEKAAHADTVEELRTVRAEVEKLRNLKISAEQKHATKFSDLQEMLKSEITRNELLNCELERQSRCAAELHAMLEEERNEHDDTAREHRRALISVQSSVSADQLPLTKALYPPSMAYTDLLISLQYLKEENLDLWHELEFLRERGMFLETERDRLSYSLDARSKSCRDLEGRASSLSSNQRILMTRLGASRTRLLSALQRIQAIFSQFQKLQYSTICALSRDESWLSQIDALNRDLDDLRAELRRLDVHAVDDTVESWSGIKTDSEKSSHIRRVRSADLTPQISTALPSSLRERHRQYLIFQKQYLLWLLSSHQETQRQTLEAVRSLENVVTSPRHSHLTPYLSAYSQHRRSLRRFRTSAWAVIAALRLRKSFNTGVLRSANPGKLPAVTFLEPYQISLAKLPETDHSSSRTSTDLAEGRSSSSMRQPGSQDPRQRSRPHTTLPWERVHSPPSKLHKSFRYTCT